VEQLVTPEGRFAVKTSFGEPELDGEDAAFQAAACLAGVPAPAVLPAVDGRWYADIGGTPVRVYDWVELLPPDRDVDPEEIGRVVASIHCTPFAGVRPEDPWYTERVGAAAWDALIADLVDGGAPFAPAVAAMRDELVALEALLRPAPALRTCHRDLWADNVRPVAGGGLCVIDWENCGLADPAQELAGVLFEFGYRDPARAGALHRAYRRAGGPAEVRTRHDFSMTIAQLGHILEAACRIWLRPGTPAEERRRQEPRVQEFVDQPLTVAVIDELVEAVLPAR
jgi:Ser/Thr protein kinase RdoA (MazF antagonist)